MGPGDQHRRDVRSVLLNLVAQLIWVVLVALAAAAATYIFSTSDLTALWRRELAVPAWLALLASAATLVLGIFMFYVTRRASVVRGRVLATDANVKLLASRSRVNINERLVRSTRFGRWPAGERLQYRSDFRQELDKAVLEEGIDVHLFPFFEFGIKEDHRHVREMWREFWAYVDRAADGLPLVLAGDFNHERRSPAAQTWSSDNWRFCFNGAVTTENGLALDDIAVNWDGGVRSKSVSTTFSDHRIIVAELGLPSHAGIARREHLITVNPAPRRR